MSKEELLMKSTHFKDITDSIVEGMRMTFEDMNKKGLLDEKTTIEDMVKHAGKNVLISEIGCSEPIRFNTLEGVKTIYPGKRYNDNLEEII